MPCSHAPRSDRVQGSGAPTGKGQCLRPGLNRGPSVYKTDALPLSHRGAMNFIRSTNSATKRQQHTNNTQTTHITSISHCHAGRLTGFCSCCAAVPHLSLCLCASVQPNNHTHHTHASKMRHARKLRTHRLTCVGTDQDEIRGRGTADPQPIPRQPTKDSCINVDRHWQQ